MEIVNLPKVGVPRKKLTPEEEEYIKDFWNKLEAKEGAEYASKILDEILALDKTCFTCKHCIRKYDSFLCTIDNMPEFTSSGSYCDRHAF